MSFQEEYLKKVKFFLFFILSILVSKHKIPKMAKKRNSKIALNCYYSKN